MSAFGGKADIAVIARSTDVSGCRCQLNKNPNHCDHQNGSEPDHGHPEVGCMGYGEHRPVHCIWSESRCRQPNVQFLVVL